MSAVSTIGDYLVCLASAVLNDFGVVGSGKVVVSGTLAVVADYCVPGGNCGGPEVVSSGLSSDVRFDTTRSVGPTWTSMFGPADCPVGWTSNTYFLSSLSHLGSNIYVCVPVVGDA